MRPILLPLLCFVTFLSGCEREPSSSLQHTENRPVQSLSEFQWQPVTLEQFLEQSGISPLPVTDPMTQRLEAWTLKLDQLLRKRYPQELAQVPVPHALVVPSDEMNAYVSFISVCINVAGQFSDATPEDLAEPEKLAFDRNFGTLGTAWDDCIDTNITDKKAAVEWLFAESTDCNIRWEDDRLLIDSACGQDTSVKAWDSISYNVGSPYIVYLTKLLKSFSEKEVLAIMAHEMAHYYRSHANVTKSSTFFYKIGRHNTNQIPLPHPEFDAFGKALVEFAAEASSEQWVSPVDDAQLHYTVQENLLHNMQRYVGSICPVASDCPQACTLAAATAGSSWTSFGSYPWEKLDANQAQQLLMFEEQALSCLTRMEATEANRIAFKDTNAAMDRHLHEYVEEPSSDFEDMRAYVLALSQAIEQASEVRRAELTAKVVQATDMGLGFYTVEQEADEYSLEWMNLLSLDPTVAVSAHLRLLELAEGNGAPAPMSIRSDHCRELYANQWMTDKNYTYVSVADFAGIHHSGCFRVFNIDREIQAHQYKKAGTDHYAGVDEQLWTELAAALPLGPASPDDEDAAWFRRHAHQCSLFHHANAPSFATGG